MGLIYDHQDWERSLYWEFNPAEGWERYHAQLDEITEYARSATEPFFIIFQPAGDVPKGNPINHMRRLIQFSKNNKMVIKTIIIMESNWIIAKAFVQLINKIMSLEPEVKLAFGIESARRIHKESLEELQNLNS